MEKTKKRKFNYNWIIAFLLGALAMYLMLLFSHLLASGKYIILAGDALEQNVAFIRMICRNLLNGETPFFSFDYYLGYNTSIPLAWYAMSPFNVLYLLFPKADVNIITAIVLILKVAMSATTFQIFSEKVLKAKQLPSVMFAVFYSMCGFTTVYGMYHFIWLDAVYILPIVALGIYLAVERNNYVVLTLSYATAFITHFYMGYMIGVFSLLLFVLYMVLRKEKGKKYLLGAVVKYGLSLLISVLLSAFIWFPALVFLINNRASDSSGFQTIQITIFDIFNNLFFGQFQGDKYAPYIYCGLPAFILLPFYFFNPEIEKKERISLGLLLFFFILASLIQPLYMMMHAFDAPDGYYTRFSFIISFLICIIACRQFEYLGEIKVKWLILWGAGLLAIYITAFFVQLFKIPGGSQNNFLNLLINVLIIGLWIILGTLYKKKGSKVVVSAIIMCIALTEVIANGAVRTNHPTSSSEFVRDEKYYSWYNNMEATIDVIKSLEEENELYRSSFSGDMMSNSDSFWGYNGITDFATGENEQLRRFMKDMGLYTQTRLEFPTGLTPSIEMLLSLKYHCILPDSSVTVETDSQPIIEINDYWLPIGFMVEEDAKNNLELGADVFENQNRVINSVSGINNIFSKVPNNLISTEENGLVLVDGTNIVIDDKYVTEVKDYSGVISILFKVRDIENDVYMLMDVAEPTEGIQYMSSCPNIAKISDLNVSAGYAAKFLESENGQYIMIQAGGPFPGELKNNGIYIYELDEAQLKKAYESLKREVFIVEEYESGYIKGKINVNGTRNVLFTSIPYAEGWKAIINGKESEIVPLLNGVFMGVELQGAGEYIVELKYQCPGAREGLLLSAVGILAMAIFFLIKERHKSKQTV